MGRNTPREDEVFCVLRTPPPALRKISRYVPSRVFRKQTFCEYISSKRIDSFIMIIANIKRNNANHNTCDTLHLLNDFFFI